MTKAGEAPAAAAARIRRSRLLRRELVAHETLAVHIERPAGFTFAPGQFIELTLPRAPRMDALGPSRSLSIASAPGEGALMLVVRLRESAFKRALAGMSLGAPLELEGPFDDLRLERATPRPLALVAGGVAIAPFLGFLREAASSGRELQATLFYSCRRPEDAPFLHELLALGRAIHGLRVVPTMTRMESSTGDWTGERRRLGLELLGAYLPSLVGPAYRIAGSPGLISQLTGELERAGVPLGDIEIEMYAGY